MSTELMVLEIKMTLLLRTVEERHLGQGKMSPRDINYDRKSSPKDPRQPWSTPGPSRALSYHEAEAKVWIHFSHQGGDASFLHGSGNSYFP